VAEVERAGDVRRRLDDDERLRVCRGVVGRAEGIGRQPAVVDRRLDGGRVVARAELASRRHRFRLLHRQYETQSETRSSKDERVVVPPSFAATASSADAGPPRAPRYRADPSGSRATFPRSVPGRAPSRLPTLSEGRVEVLLTVTAVPGSLALPRHDPFEWVSGRDRGSRRSHPQDATRPSPRRPRAGRSRPEGRRRHGAWRGR
jgi:hypothetical protein